jgi:AbrB family looped-hinge helix DNA binding protein
MVKSNTRPMDSTLTQKGQATLPKAVRDFLGVKPGDKIKFFMHPDGSVVILPVAPAARLRGMFSSPLRRPATDEEFDAAIEREAAHRFETSR